MKNKIKYLKLNKKYFIHSLLAVLIGVFLLPNIAYFSSITTKNIINLTNKEREKNGLSKITTNELLSKAAYKKGLEILNSQTFSHTINEKKFSTWIKESGYKYLYSGENLAINFLTSEGAIKAWLDSETHKENILNPNFKEIGVAIVEGEFEGENSIIIVQVFGSPLPQIIHHKIKPISEINTTNYTINSSISTNYIKNENLLNRSATNKQINYEQNYNLLKVVQKNILIFSILLVLTILITMIEAIYYIFPCKKYKIKRNKAKINR